MSEQQADAEREFIKKFEALDKRQQIFYLVYSMLKRTFESAQSKDVKYDIASAVIEFHAAASMWSAVELISKFYSDPQTRTEFNEVLSRFLSEVHERKIESVKRAKNLIELLREEDVRNKETKE